MVHHRRNYWSEVSEVCGIHVNDHNAWNESSIQSIPLKDRLKGGTDGDMRLGFMKSMLNWVPEREKMVAEPLNH